LHDKQEVRTVVLSSQADSGIKMFFFLKIPLWIVFSVCVFDISFAEMRNLMKIIQTRSFSKFEVLRDVIIRETEIVNQSVTPEIKLRLITENCRLFNATAEELNRLPFSDPFWGFYWPGGMSMSRYILDHPEVVWNKTVLDFGSGCGATSIACKMKSCRKVVANDIDEAAAVAAKINAELNHVLIETDTRNLINDPSSYDFDVVLFGDVFYDEAFAALLSPWIIKLSANKQTCLVGDPGRHALSKSLNLELLARYELPPNVCIENHGFKFTNVFKVC
jgi:ETFB lysine methyltransferase